MADAKSRVEDTRSTSLPDLARKAVAAANKFLRRSDKNKTEVSSFSSAI
jgi:hypothetical protein